MIGVRAVRSGVSPKRYPMIGCESLRPRGSPFARWEVPREHRTRPRPGLRTRPSVVHWIGQPGPDRRSAGDAGDREDRTDPDTRDRAPGLARSAWLLLSSRLERNS